MHMEKNQNLKDRLISFVIPCYNSGKTIESVVRQIDDVMKTREGYEYEVILVNDNPPDDTWRIIKDLHQKNPKVTGLCMSHNFGQHNALMAGYRKAKGDIIVSLDDDGQNPPSEVFKLVDRLNGNTNVVYGDYTDDKFASGFRKLGSDFNDWTATWLLNKPKELYFSSYIATTREVIDQVNRYTGPYPFVDGLMLRSGSGIVNQNVDHQKRQEGQSGYSLSKLLNLWANGFTAFSVKPLRIGALLGAICAGFGFLFSLFVVIQKLIYQDAVDAGWSSIICIMMILGGLILLMLGLIGEYVGRIYLTMNSTPQYIIFETTESDSQS